MSNSIEEDTGDFNNLLDDMRKASVTPKGVEPNKVNEWVEILESIQATIPRPALHYAFTDSEILALWEVMNNASKFFCSSPNHFGSWTEMHNKSVIAKARQWLNGVGQ